MIDSYEKIQEVVERVKAIREACGPYFGIAVDFHGRVHKPMAKVLAKELEPYNLMFIEEPVLPENNEELGKIGQLSKTPIATGERMFTRWDFKKLLESGDADVIQPDLSHAGGITECKKIASMAEAYDVAVAFHCPLGPIALAACLQVDATVYNAFIQEQSLGIHYNASNDLLDYVKNPEVFEYENGMVKIPSLPGLGVEVNEELVREKAKETTNWHNPVWRHEDGSIAEW
jgi:galactonate dehydratase